MNQFNVTRHVNVFNGEACLDPDPPPSLQCPLMGLCSSHRISVTITQFQKANFIKIIKKRSVAPSSDTSSPLNVIWQPSPLSATNSSSKLKVHRRIVGWGS